MREKSSDKKMLGEMIREIEISRELFRNYLLVVFLLEKLLVRMGILRSQEW